MKKQICIMIMALSAIYVCQATTAPFTALSLNRQVYQGMPMLSASENTSSAFYISTPHVSLSDTSVPAEHDVEKTGNTVFQADTLFSIIMAALLVISLRNPKYRYRRRRNQ